MISRNIDDLAAIVELAQAKMSEIVRGVMPGARLDRIGPVEFSLTWTCWVITDTDLRRDRLASDPELCGRLAEATDFPPARFVFQSQETVTRDYQGSWFYAMR